MTADPVLKAMERALRAEIGKHRVNMTRWVLVSSWDRRGIDPSSKTLRDGIAELVGKTAARDYTIAVQAKELNRVRYLRLILSMIQVAENQDGRLDEVVSGVRRGESFVRISSISAGDEFPPMAVALKGDSGGKYRLVHRAISIKH